MPIVWRIVPEHRAKSAFDGEGARLFGGRWNSRGTKIVYCAESRALAALETLVHLTPATMKRPLRLLGLSVEEDWVETMPAGKLPADWRAPIIPSANKQIGDHWISRGRNAVLKIPSVIIPEEYNYLVNPAHPKLARLRILQSSDFLLDGRLKVSR